jgi:hypothetical protein
VTITSVLSDSPSPHDFRRKIIRNLFEGEENATNWRAESHGDARGTSRREDLSPFRLVVLKLDEQAGHDVAHATRHVDEGPFFAQ